MISCLNDGVVSSSVVIKSVAPLEVKSQTQTIALQDSLNVNNYR